MVESNRLSHWEAMSDMRTVTAHRGHTYVGITRSQTRKVRTTDRISAYIRRGRRSLSYQQQANRNGGERQQNTKQQQRQQPRTTIAGAMIATKAVRAAVSNRAISATATAASIVHARSSCTTSNNVCSIRFAHTVARSAANLSAAAPSAGVVGEILGHALDLGSAWVGQQIESPFEATVAEAEHTLWISAFHHHDRITTSVPFAQTLGLTSLVLPYSMLLFKTISMTHVDENLNVLDLGYDNAVYIRPAFANDTLRQIFTIKHLRNTSAGNATIVTVGCELLNQRQQLVFTCDKMMLYPHATPELRISAAPLQAPAKPRSPLLAHLLYHGESLPSSNFLAPLKKGQMILHSTARPLTTSMNMQLSTLFKWQHPSIYNVQRYKNDDLLVPGGLLVAATLGASSRSFFEILYEQIDSCALINRVSPVDLIGAVSFVRGIKTIKEGFEEVSVTTLGLKNIDVTAELKDVRVPVELFTRKHKPSQLEAMLRDECPQLEGKIVVVITRTLVRQSPYTQKKNIPLL